MMFALISVQYLYMFRFLAYKLEHRAPCLSFQKNIAEQMASFDHTS